MNDKLIIEGLDNRGIPRQSYADRIAMMNDHRFVVEAELKIWLSIYADNNPCYDYHWQAGACEKEAKRRGKPELFQSALKKARGDND